jgi:nucleotidyltransferase/DNA polymerase involved in DNA repair
VTFPEDTGDFGYVLNALDGLSEEVSRNVLDRQLYFKTVTVRVRYENFETHTHSKTLPFMTDRLQDLKKAAGELMLPYFKPGRKIRLVGVRVSSLVSGLKQKKLI